MQHRQFETRYGASHLAAQAPGLEVGRPIVLARSKRPFAAVRPFERGRESASQNNVEVFAPFRGAEEMVKDLKAKVLPGEAIKFLATGVAGKMVRTL